MAMLCSFSCCFDNDVNAKTLLVPNKIMLIFIITAANIIFNAFHKLNFKAHEYNTRINLILYLNQMQNKLPKLEIMNDTTPDRITMNKTQGNANNTDTSTPFNSMVQSRTKIKNGCKTPGFPDTKLSGT